MDKTSWYKCFSLTFTFTMVNYPFPFLCHFQWTVADESFLLGRTDEEVKRSGTQACKSKKEEAKCRSFKTIFFSERLTEFLKRLRNRTGDNIRFDHLHKLCRTGDFASQTEGTRRAVVFYVDKGHNLIISMFHHGLSEVLCDDPLFHSGVSGKNLKNAALRS